MSQKCPDHKKQGREGAKIANNEFYSQDEFKAFSEFKSYRAEIYSRPREIGDKSLEISADAPETLFGARTSPSEPTESKKETDSASKDSMRVKFKRLVEGIKDATVKVLGTVSVTAVVAASALIALPEIVDIPSFGDIGDLPSDDEPTPPPLDDVIPDVPVEDITPEPPPEEEIIPGPEYTALLNLSAVNDAKIVWGDGVNTVVLEDLFLRGEDDACAYRVSLLGEDGEVIESLVGRDESLSIRLDASVGYMKIRVEEIYESGGETFVFDFATSDAYYLSLPTIRFLDGKILESHGYYLIPYVIESPVAHMESYTHLEFSVTMGGEVIPPEEITVNEQCYLGVYMDSAVAEFDVSASGTLNGAYGGGERHISAERTYLNEPELHVVNSYYKLADPWYDDSDSIVFDFKYSAPAGAHIVMVNNLTGEEIALGEYEYSHSYAVDTVASVSYKLVSAEGDLLCETESFAFDATSAKSYEKPVFNYKNPIDVTVTYNPDGTINVYIPTNFEPTDPAMYYEVVLNGREYRFTEPLAAIEHLPNESSSLAYRVCVDDEFGAKYAILTASVSGTIDPAYLPIGVSSSEGVLSFSIAYNYERLGDSVKLLVNGEDEILIDKSELVYNEDTYEYAYTLEYDGEISSVTVEYYAAYGDSYGRLLEAYGSDVIKGDEHTVCTEEFTFESIEGE